MSTLIKIDVFDYLPLFELGISNLQICARNLPTLFSRFTCKLGIPVICRQIVSCMPDDFLLHHWSPMRRPIINGSGILLRTRGCLFSSPRHIFCSFDPKQTVWCFVERRSINVLIDIFFSCLNPTKEGREKYWTLIEVWS